MNSGIFQHEYQQIRKKTPKEGTQFIYEVIRVKNGSPLFLREHIKRLIQSHQLVFSSEMGSSDEGCQEALKQADGIEKTLCADCLNLIQRENIENQNIRIEVFYQPDLQIAVFAVPSAYPSAEVVKSGVRLITVTATREDPHAKTDPREFRKKIVAKMKQQGAFEAALVDSDGKLTEGTRSNLFFVKGDRVFTPPGDKVLLGITRQMVVKACERLGIELVEESIEVKELFRVKAAFMTGTSVDVLPISHINNIALQSAEDPMVMQIRRAYLDLCEKDFERMSESCADDSNWMSH
ncbi:aminotransferase class IV [Gottschalkiaceae bacterium SANA]|nr:aminotransferase class IV [Gottschalkiaceae bacterium SANA]